MDFKLKDVLEAIGPTASLIFAAWIFLTFLQQRYSAAYERYRSLIQEYRSDHLNEPRRASIKSQILLYKRRCQHMKLATNLGAYAAICLILTLICGALNAMVETLDFLKYVGTASALLGLLLVIAAAILVITENTLIQRAIDSELSDIPGLAIAADVLPSTTRK
jgi:Protein of unknown function (DUF2721)